MFLGKVLKSYIKTAQSAK